MDKEALKTKAIEGVNRLQHTAEHHERVYSEKIDAVWVFSGPGTYYERVKPGQPDHMRWMDRDRIRAGVAVVREVTAARINQVGNQKIIPSKMDKEVGKEGFKRLIHAFGPWFVYNGTPIENRTIRQALESQYSRIPKDKSVVIDLIKEDDGTSSTIRHTGDQVKSFYQNLSDPNSPLFGIRNVAIVAHVSDFVRIPFYLQKYDKELQAAGHHQGINFWAFAIRNRMGSSLKPEDTGLIERENEIERLLTYAERGDLASEPIYFKAASA